MTIRINSMAEVQVTNPDTLEFSSFTAATGDVVTIADDVEVCIIPLKDEKISDVCDGNM